MRLAALLVLAACGELAVAPGDAAVDAATDAAIDAPAIDAPPPDAWVEFAGTLTGAVTSGGAPVAGAAVRFGGRPELATTAADGTFALTVIEPVRLTDLGLTASRVGFWNAGTRVEDPLAPQLIELRPVSLVDDPAYRFKSADDGDTTPYCTHCHVEQVADWQGSAHARAASDRQLHDLYNGTAAGVVDEATCVARGGQWRLGKTYGAAGATMKCYVGAGVLPDLNPGACGGAGQPTCDDPSAQPADVSVCADCHAPASAGHVPGATNLNAVDGIAFDEGVTCDFCHKVNSVAVNQRPGVFGAITLQRPAPPDDPGGFSDPEVMFGPYGDAIAFFMGGSVQPQFRSSELCSACHQWSEPGFRPEDKALVDPLKWPEGLPLQDTYEEWATTSWAAAGTQCQHCHMPASQRTNAATDKHGLPPSPAGNLGWDRPYGAIRRHLFRARVPQLPDGWVPPPGEPALETLRSPLTVDLTVSRANGVISASVSVANVGAGHAFPSGTPTRALFLLVRAEAAGTSLAAVGGQTVPEWTGALAAGTLGSGAHLEGNALVLGSVPPAITTGATIRFVRATGAFADDPGVGWFGDPMRTAPQKGLDIWAPAGEARVVGVQSDRVLLDRELDVPAGARFLVGHTPALAGLAADAELPEVALAGAPGWVFAKVMKAADGTRAVPFWRATDLASDNRIPAGATTTTSHEFADARGPIVVTATLLYRRHNFTQAHLRGWSAVDVVRVVRTVTAP